MSDVTDDTFERLVLQRSDDVPVIVDLWAPWCGPCRTLGPLLEEQVALAGGKVELAKVNVDENPRTSNTFSVQSIPAVYALRHRKIVDQFLGAVPRQTVEAFVARLLPSEPTEVDRLVEAGGEDDLRAALDIEPGNEKAIVALAGLLVEAEKRDEALMFLSRIPESAETRRLTALARTGDVSGQQRPIDVQLEGLLGHVKQDESARQRYLDLLEVLGADDPLTVEYRRRLAAALF